MSKNKKDQVKVADLVIFCNDKDSQQYLVFDLKYGDNFIGKNSAKCSVVFRFTNEIDDVHTKISIDDDDYTIEDLGSVRGTFKIKSDNSLIRLKPNKSYDLSNNQLFYIGKYKCMFQIVKPGRGMAFSLSPSDLMNSQKNISSTTNTTTANNKKGLKKTQSLEDDIEDYTGLSSKLGNKKVQPATTSKSILNKMEAEHIEEEEEEESHLAQKGLNKLVVSNGPQAKKTTNNQKNFVKAKGQLAKGIKGTFKNVVNDDHKDAIKEDKHEVIDTQIKKNSIDDDEECEFQFSFPKSFKKSTNQDEQPATGKRRASINRKNTLESQVEKFDEESMKLDSQFLKRIQEKLKNNTQLNEQRQVLNELANKYSSQKKMSQKQSQDIPYLEDEKLPSLDKQESDNYWQPQVGKRGNNKIESSLDSEKSKTKSKTSSKGEAEAASKKSLKQKEEIEKEAPKNNKKGQVEVKKETESTTTSSKKVQKVELKKDEKMEKLKQQAQDVLKTISSSNSKKEETQVNAKSDKKAKIDNKKKSKSKDFDDSTSISNDKSDDEEFSIDEDDQLSQSQKVTKVASTRKRKYDDMMTQQAKPEIKPKQNKEKEDKKKINGNDTEKKQKIEKGKEEKEPTKKEKEQPKKEKELPKKEKSQNNGLKVEETPKKSSSRIANKKDNSKESLKMEVEAEDKKSATKKTPKSKASKKDEPDEVLVNSSIRRSTRKAQSDEVEKIEEEKKSTKKSVAKVSVAKKSTKKQAVKEIEEEEQSSEEIDVNGSMEVEEEEEEVEEEKPRRSVRKSGVQVEDKKVNKSKPKGKAEKQIETKAKGGKKEVEKQITKPKNLIRRTQSSKKEVLQLQQSAGNFMDIPRRNKYRIIFSNSLTTDEEKKEMSTYGVKILNDFHNANDFNILVTDEIKRRLKTLVALNKGYPIVSQNWIKNCIKEDKLIPYEPYIITKVDKALAKQHNFDLKKSIKNQKEHPDGILHNLTFVCQNSFESLGKEEIRKLVESAGGTFLYDKPKHTSAYFLSDSTKTDYNQKLNEENHIVLDIEGLFQTCLLQFNVLDNHIIINQEKKSSRKK